MRRDLSRTNPLVTEVVIQSPIGNMVLSLFGDLYIYKIRLLASEVFFQSSLKTAARRLAYQCTQDLAGYFFNPSFKFNTPYQLIGSPFQMTVWKQLLQLKVGQTTTYSELAHKLNTSARAIGNACRANPLMLVVPCHRVLGKTGLGGFAGDRIGNKVAIKQWLLNHEKKAGY